MAPSPGPASAEIPSTTCWPPGRDASQTRNDKRQSRPPPPPSFSPPAPGCLNASVRNFSLPPGLSANHVRLIGEMWRATEGAAGLHTFTYMDSWSSAPKTNQQVWFSCHTFSLPRSMDMTSLQVPLKHNGCASGAHACMWVLMFVFVCVHAVSAHSIYRMGVLQALPLLCFI